jgi:hypothetical protein
VSTLIDRSYKTGKVLAILGILAILGTMSMPMRMPSVPAAGLYAR